MVSEECASGAVCSPCVRVCSSFRSPGLAIRGLGSEVKKIGSSFFCHRKGRYFCSEQVPVSHVVQDTRSCCRLDF